MHRKIESDSPSLYKLLVEPARYVIPLFQRGYRWGQREWGTLWGDLKHVESAADGESHFMGFLVMEGEIKPGHVPIYSLVDGQQRLSTSSILLAAIRNVAADNGHDDFANDINGDYLVHPRKPEGDARYRLFPKDRDRANYVALIKNDGSHVDGPMADAMGFFAGKIQADTGGDLQKLNSICHAVLHRLQFVTVVLSHNQNAYEIFKSLNSKGVGLGQSDHIRNFMFMNTPLDRQEEFDRDKWKPLEQSFSNEDDGGLGVKEEKHFSQFFRHFLMDKGYVSPKLISETFEGRFAEKCKTESSLWRVADELKTASSNYAIISSWEEDEDDGVTQSLRGFNDLDSSTTYPLLFVLFAHRAKGDITPKQLAQCIEMLRGFIFRRYICGITSRGYGRLFSRYNKVLAKSKNPVKMLSEVLKRHKHGWPSDEKFVAAFEKFPFYQGGYAWEMLAGIERSRGHREGDNLKKSEVEHVMPQTLTDEWREMLGENADIIYDKWLHLPGNLALTKYNQVLQNHSYETKVGTYRDSHYVITKEIARTYPHHWGVEQMRERGSQMAAEAVQIWIGPDE